MQQVCPSGLWGRSSTSGPWGTLAGVGGQIEGETLAGHRRSRVVGASIASACLFFIVVLFVLGLNKSIAAAAIAVAIPCAFVAFCLATATAVKSSVVVRLGSVHGWELMPCQTQEAGRGRAMRIEILVRRFVRLQPWDGMSNSRVLLGVTEVELAGEVTGKALIRIPGTSKIYIFRAV